MENNFVWKSFLMKTGYQSAIRCHSDGSLSECGGVTRHYWADSAQVFSLAAQFCTSCALKRIFQLSTTDCWLCRIFGQYRPTPLAWQDERLLFDIDTPEDYQRLLKDNG
jgi:hypothetical protein